MHHGHDGPRGIHQQCSLSSTHHLVRRLVVVAPARLRLDKKYTSALVSGALDNVTLVSGALESFQQLAIKVPHACVEFRIHALLVIFTGPGCFLASQVSGHDANDPRIKVEDRFHVPSLQILLETLEVSLHQLVGLVRGLHAMTAPGH